MHESQGSGICLNYKTKEVWFSLIKNIICLENFNKIWHIYIWIWIIFYLLEKYFENKLDKMILTSKANCYNYGMIFQLMGLIVVIFLKSELNIEYCV